MRMKESAREEEEEEEEAAKRQNHARVHVQGIQHKRVEPHETAHETQ